MASKPTSANPAGEPTEPWRWHDDKLREIVEKGRAGRSLRPDKQHASVGEGDEVALHSWIHELNSTLLPADEREFQMRAVDTLDEVTGVRPVGIRTPPWDFTPHTRAITREMGSCTIAL